MRCLAVLLAGLINNTMTLPAVPDAGNGTVLLAEMGSNTLVSWRLGALQPCS